MVLLQKVLVQISFMKNKKLERSIILLVILTFVGIIVYISYKNHQLKRDGILISAQVLSSFSSIKGNNALICKVFYKGKEFKMPSPTSVPLKRRESIVGKYFPAIYLPNSSYMQILVLPGDFEKYNLPYPDSLKEWYSRYEGFK